MALLAAAETRCRCLATIETILANNLFTCNIISNINTSFNHSHHCNRSQAISIISSRITTIVTSIRAVLTCAVNLHVVESAAQIRTGRCRHGCTRSSEMSASKGGRLQAAAKRYLRQEAVSPRKSKRIDSHATRHATTVTYINSS